MSDEPSDKLQAAKGAIKSIVSSAGAAAKLIAAKAEQTKLTTLTLPAAYRELGKDCVQNKRHLEGNEALTTPLQGVLAESKALKEAAASQPVATSLTDKAKAAGKQAADVARQKSLSMRRDSLLVDLGKAIFEQQRDQSGPERIVQPIHEALARLSKLGDDITQLSSVGAGSWVTPKRLIIAVTALLAIGTASFWKMGGQSSLAITDSDEAEHRAIAKAINEGDELWSKAEKLQQSMEPLESHLYKAYKEATQRKEDPESDPQVLKDREKLAPMTDACKKTFYCEVE